MDKNKNSLEDFIKNQNKSELKKSELLAMEIREQAFCAYDDGLILI